MEKKRTHIFAGKLLILAGTLMLILGFLIPDASLPAGKPDIIRVSVIGDFSGPYAPAVGAARPAVMDAWEYINKELGGVHGVKVEPVLRDMAGKIDLGLSVYNEVINSKPKSVFVDIIITPLSAALRQRYVEDDVVGFHAGAIDSLYPQGNSYGFNPLYPELAGVGLKWIKENWKEKRNPRVGIITWDTAYGKAILVDEFYAYAKEIGVDLVGTPQLFGIRDVDVTVQLLNLRGQKSDYLLTNAGGGGALAIKKGCKEMEWNITLVNTVGCDWGGVRLGPSYFEGDVAVLFVKSFDEADDPSIKILMKHFNQNNRTINEKTLYYIVSWCNALLEQKIMTDVVTKFGWEGLNTKNIKETLNTLKEFAPLNGITRLSFSQKRRTPKIARVYEIKTGGRLLPLTDFIEVPDMRPAKFR